MDIIKLVTVGDAFSGDGTGIRNYKTALCQVLAQSHGLKDDTIAMSFDNYSITAMVNGEPITVGFFDTAGQEDYARLRPLTYPQTDIILVTFIMQVERTLDNVIAKWIPEIKDFAKDAACFLVGINAAKVDYPEDAKPVDFSKIVKVTRTCGFLKFFQINDLFDQTMFASNLLNDILRLYYKNLVKEEKKVKPIKGSVGLNLSELLEVGSVGSKRNVKNVAKELERRTEGGLLQSQELQDNYTLVFNFCILNHPTLKNSVIIDLIKSNLDDFEINAKLNSQTLMMIRDETLLIMIFDLFEEGKLVDYLLSLHLSIYDVIAQRNFLALHDYLIRWVNQDSLKVIRQKGTEKGRNIFYICADYGHYDLLDSFRTNFPLEDVVKMLDESHPTPFSRMCKEEYIVPILENSNIFNQLSLATKQEILITACKNNLKTVIDCLQNTLDQGTFLDLVKGLDAMERNALMIAAMNTSDTVLLTLISTTFFGAGHKKVEDEGNEDIGELLHHKDYEGRTLLKIVIDQGEPMAIVRDLLIKIERDYFKKDNISSMVQYFKDTIGPCEIIVKAIADEEASRSKSVYDKVKIWAKIFLEFLLPFAIFLQDVITDSLLTIKYQKAMEGNSTDQLVTCNTTTDCPLVMDETMQALVEIPKGLDAKPCFIYSLVFMLLPLVCYFIDWFLRKKFLLTNNLLLWISLSGGIKHILVTPFYFMYQCFTHLLWIVFWPIINMVLRYQKTGLYITSLGEDRAHHKIKLEEQINLTTRAQMFEVSIESSFQPLLQIYLYLPCFILDAYCEKFDDSWSHAFNRLELWAIMSSVVSLAWAFNTHEANEHNGALSFSANPLARILLLISTLMKIFGRLICLILVTYCTGSGNFWPLMVFVTCHIVLVIVIDFSCSYKMVPKITTEIIFNCLFNGLANIYTCHNWFNPSVKSSPSGQSFNTTYTLRCILIESLLMLENLMAVTVVWTTFSLTLPFYLCLISFFLYFGGVLLKLFYYKQLHIWRILYWEHFISLAWIPCMKKSIPEEDGTSIENEAMLPKVGESEKNLDIELQLSTNAK